MLEGIQVSALHWASKNGNLRQKKHTNLKQVLKIRAPSMLILIFVDNSIENCKFCLQLTQKSLQSLLN